MHKKEYQFRRWTPNDQAQKCSSLEAFGLNLFKRKAFGFWYNKVYKDKRAKAYHKEYVEQHSSSQQCLS